MKRGDIPEVHRLLMADFQANPAPIIDFIAAQERNPFKILIGTILSARTRDETTSEVLVKKLFPVVKNFDDLRRKTLKEIEQLIYPVGFYHQKARALKKLPDVLDEKFGGQIPDTVEALCELPGVGRKTANLVVAVAFDKPAICVDIHVHRINNRLGLLKTKAEPNADGSYSITGTKIFISAGEHDLSDNIIHLVLARMPDSPKDVKGISLFIVPKFLEDGSRNPVSCGALEHKMGIKANATAVINLDGAKGWLIGEKNKGLACMFTMMNAARLGCGMQGLGIGEASFQGALAYAKERLQMRALNGPACPDKPADPIIVHPDVRRMLMTQKAYTEAGRALTAFLALQLDIEEKSTDEAARQDAADTVALLTPVAKAFMTDNGFLAANMGVQVFGGHGFIREWGMEQLVRDCRISQLYEGTNGIQAIDLLGRKVLMDQGAKLRKFTKQIHKFCEANAGNAQIKELVEPLNALNKQIAEITMGIGMAAMMNKDEAGAAATDYLRLIGHLTYGYFWAWMAKVAAEKMEGSPEAAFYNAKITTARFYFAKLFPETQSLIVTLKAGAKPLMALEADHFAF